VCGVSAKLKCPDFLTWLNNYEIICLQETKTDDTDSICVPGYDVHLFNRQKITRYRSGGIAVFVKKEISKYITFDKHSNSNLIKFFKISKEVCNTTSNEDIVCGVVYLPPNGSKFSHNDPYFEMQNEIFRYCNDSKNIILLGDFNSRCGNLSDYTVTDDLICSTFELQNIQEEEGNIFKQFEIQNIQLNRNHADISINNYGRQLVEFCKVNNLFIWNGRIGRDKDNPKLTCKDKSVIDYCLSTSFVFETIDNFEVEEFCDLYSDVHCALSISLNVNITSVNEETVNGTKNKIKLWDRYKPEKFREKVDISKLENIENRLDHLGQNQTINNTDINNVVDDLTSIFENTAKEAFGTIRPKQNTTNYQQKIPWFNSSCQRLRNHYHFIRKEYNKHKTQTLKISLKKISKEYKTSLRQAHNKYATNKVNDLRKLKHADPKKYWQIINSEKPTQNTQANLEQFFNYFKKQNENFQHINEATNSDQDLHTFNHEHNETNGEINRPITEKEIEEAVRTLKNNKSPGQDNILNEHIKNTIDLLKPIYVKLFNLIFNTGYIPETWTDGLIKPIYKQKGNPNSPENYRPISLLSCMGKLFTNILNKRLNKYAENNNIIQETQAGFRRNHSTLDNVFILKSLIDILKNDKKKMYCCFIDFKQAFDSVWRNGLWNKLLKENINGKCFNIITSIYNNIKSRVITCEGTSAPFLSLSGVRQGENLSPFLFSIFLNDLENFLKNNGVNGIEKGTLVEETRIYVKLCILLYADDTVIFSDNPTDLQTALDLFNQYCKTWKLNINTSKTKILTISKGRNQNNNRFKIGNEVLEEIHEYKYLGIFFTRTGSFVKTKSYIAEQANKAMFSLLKKIKRLSLPFDLQIELFEKTVKPILLYGCELWGYGNFDTIERVQLKFYKYIFNLKKSTPNYMIYGELGITPLEVDIKSRTISFWSKLIDNINNNENTKLASKVYLLVYNLYIENSLKSQWFDNLKHILCHSGYSGIWYSQSFFSSKWLVKSAQQKLKDHFIQKWHSDIEKTSQTNIYKHTKSSFKQSYYIKHLPKFQSKTLISFITRNHHLPIETGRWQNIPANQRKCIHCNDIGDEFHFILKCQRFNDDRKKYIEPYFYKRPNMMKFICLFQSENIANLKKLSLFCNQIMKSFKNNTFN
jgi:hypothetical protein